MRDRLKLFIWWRSLNFWSIICPGQTFLYLPLKYPGLLIEIDKTRHDMYGNNLKELIVTREWESLRSKPELLIPSVNSVLKGKNSLRCFGSVIWNSSPIDITEDHSILSFVIKIKQWKPIACRCTIWKSCIGRVG